MESIFVKFAQYPSIETGAFVAPTCNLDDAEDMFEHASDRENTRCHLLSNKSKL